jgi:ribosomal protection tetracycline resistance protein
VGSCGVFVDHPCIESSVVDVQRVNPTWFLEDYQTMEIPENIGKTINIGVLAHVDAGKTTITEHFLYLSGVIQKAGSVDRGTTATDSLAVEKDRGISVRASVESFFWKGQHINIIDTPGHVDFCSEVERSLRALDGAILVLSAVEGVQAHTKTLFEALRATGVPVIIFINKIDRPGSDVDRVFTEIRRELYPDCLLLQEPQHLGTCHACPGRHWTPADYSESTGEDFFSEIVEKMVEQDDEILVRYLEGKSISFQTLDSIMACSVRNMSVVPVLLGSAKLNSGLVELLNVVIRYFSVRKIPDETGLSAIVFKIEHDHKLGKLAYVRVFSGSLEPRSVVRISTLGISAKINQIKRVHRGKYEDTRLIGPGDIGVLSGLHGVGVGDVLGDNGPVPDVYSWTAPLLQVQVTPRNPADLARLVHAFHELSEEDPQLDVGWQTELKILHIRVNGNIHIEILQSILLERYGISVDFEEPCIIYKETPIQVGYGYERYWMPKPCWAILKFRIEPGGPGSGAVYRSEVSFNKIAEKYQNEISSSIDRALSQGIKGWEVTDIIMTLVEGEDHPVHSRPGNFATATPMALMNALVETGTRLLEPVLRFTIRAERSLFGAVSSDIIRMRGRYDSPGFEQGFFVLHGKVPASTSLDYMTRLASLSGGKARMTTHLDGYEPCSLEHGRTTEYRGISPLDRDKWILKARGALS